MVVMDESVSVVLSTKYASLSVIVLFDALMLLCY